MASGRTVDNQRGVIRLDKLVAITNSQALQTLVLSRRIAPALVNHFAIFLSAFVDQALSASRTEQLSQPRVVAERTYHLGGSRHPHRPN